MNSLKNIGLLFLSLILIFTACRKDEEINGSFPPVPVEPEVVVNGSFHGVVMDQNNQPLVSAEVTYDNEMKLTDENGYFSFRNVDINTKGSLVTIEKDGYFKNAKFVNSELNRQNHTSVQLIEKELTGSFPATVGGTINTADGAVIEFSPGSIKYESGQVYTGDVNVYATWLDPMGEDLIERMPGDLRAFNIEGQQQQLTTFGMIGVELEDENGEKLNIADNRTASIELPVPQELISAAPELIPLWHFNETTGYWEEEGSALLSEGKYTGEVSHFSFWNCDVPSTFVFLDGIILDKEGNPAPNIQVQIEVTGSGTSASDFTDNTGFYGGFVPDGIELTLNIFDNCDVQIFTQSVGPLTEDTTLDTITLSLVEALADISGLLTGCDGELVSDGYLGVFVGEDFVIFPTDEEGNINGVLNTCNETTIEIRGFDLQGFGRSEAVSIDVTPEEAIEFGTLAICEELTEFITLEIDGEAITVFNPGAAVSTVNGEDGFTSIFGNNPDPEVNLSFTFAVMLEAPGTYTAAASTVLYIDPAFSTQVALICGNNPMCDVTFEITNYEGEGGLYSGSFSGSIEPNEFDPGDAREVNGSFNLLIDQ